MRKQLIGIGALAAALLLAACGGDEFSPSPADLRQLAEGQEDLAFSDPDDTAVRSIDLTTSSEYDPAADEVQVFALVKDQDRNLLRNLNQHNFSVVIDPRSLNRTVPSDTTTLSTALSGDKLVALVIDSSGSMSATTDTGGTRMEVAKEAARLFVDLMAAGDKTAVVDFDSDARTVQNLTDDAAQLNAAIDLFSADGATNLGSAVTQAVKAVGTRPGRRAAILLTDGDDTVDSVEGGPGAWLNNPGSTRNQGLQLAIENELILYTVGLGDGLSDTGLSDLRAFAEETGGEFFLAPTAGSLLTAFGQTIPAALEALPPVETYLLTFPNSIPAVVGKELDVPFRLGVVFENGVARHTAKFNGTYTVE